MRSADALGAQSALGAAIVYDSTVHGSWAQVRDMTRKQFGELKQIGEVQWMSDYVETRRQWLATYPNPLLHKTVYRMDAFRQIVNAGNWKLGLPLVVRGLSITPDSLSDTHPVNVPAEGAPRRQLRLATPPMTGPDVAWLQQRLTLAGIHIAENGAFDAATDTAVKAFQTTHDLKADGVVGPVTRSALEDIPLITPAKVADAGNKRTDAGCCRSQTGARAGCGSGYSPNNDDCAGRHWRCHGRHQGPCHRASEDRCRCRAEDDRRHASASGFARAAHGKICAAEESAARNRAGSDDRSQHRQYGRPSRSRRGGQSAHSSVRGNPRQHRLGDGGPVEGSGLRACAAFPGPAASPQDAQRFFAESYVYLHALLASIPNEWIFRIRIVAVLLIFYALYRLRKAHLSLSSIQQRVSQVQGDISTAKQDFAEAQQVAQDVETGRSGR